MTFRRKLGVSVFPQIIYRNKTLRGIFGSVFLITLIGRLIYRECGLPTAIVDRPTPLWRRFLLNFIVRVIINRTSSPLSDATPLFSFHLLLLPLSSYRSSLFLERGARRTDRSIRHSLCRHRRCCSR